MDDYRPGGQVTSPGDPAADPATWRPCATCGARTRLGHAQCTDCTDAEHASRTRGTAVARLPAEETPHSGHIVALPRLLDPQRRLPSGGTRR